MILWHWWMQVTGAHGALGWLFSTTGRWYAIASGVGVGIFMRLANRGVCHEDGCYWPAWRTTVEANGEHYPRCKRHHRGRHA